MHFSKVSFRFWQHIIPQNLTNFFIHCTRDNRFRKIILRNDSTRYANLPRALGRRKFARRGKKRYHPPCTHGVNRRENRQAAPPDTPTTSCIAPTTYDATRNFPAVVFQDMHRSSREGSCFEVLPSKQSYRIVLNTPPPTEIKETLIK